MLPQSHAQELLLPRLPLQHYGGHAYHQKRQNHRRLLSSNYSTINKNNWRDPKRGVQQLEQPFRKYWTSWLAAKIPKGFEDFFPDDDEITGRNKKRNPELDEGTDAENEMDEATASKEAKEGTTKEEDIERVASSSNNKEGKQQQQQAPPPPPLDDNANLPGLIALLVIIIMLRSVLEGDDENTDSGTGQEITFVEFRNKFLLTDKVEKLVVVNDKVARVVLKPDAMVDDGSGSSVGAGGVGTEIGMDQDTSSWQRESAAIMDHPSSDVATAAARSNGRASYYFYIGSTESLEDRLTRAQSDANKPPMEWVEIQYVTSTNWGLELIKYLPTAAFIAAIYFGSRGLGGMPGGMGGRGGSGGGGGMGNIFSVGKSTARKVNKEDVQVTFADVAGCDEAKREVMEFVDFLKDSTRFSKLGAKIPKGALLCGPPGTGKTLLAKATAGEAGVPFYSISGSDFIEMFVGVGPSRVRDLFKEARSSAPCIVFIDEIDAVGRQRGRGGFSGGGSDERENTLNQLLVEMDGFSPSSGVVVLAGTNRSDILDQALTRPGRFDRQIQVDRPDLVGRKQIFKVHLKGKTLDRGDIGEDENGDDLIDAFAGRLAGLTPGFAGADIANLCNEGAILAARRKASAVSIEDFEKATDRIIGGLESNKIMSKQERSLVAHHEAGHAVTGWFLEHTDPLMKVTIIPRTSGALGFAQYLPKEVSLRTQDQIMDLVCMALAGRAAEDVFFDGQITTGASDDLKRVTQMVYGTIKDYGMNDKLGQLAFPDQEGGIFPGTKAYSDSTAEAMDDEARAIVAAAYERTVALVKEHKEDIQKVANLLLEKETITHDDMVDLIGPRPFQGDKAYQE